jgi:nitroreductase
MGENSMSELIREIEIRRAKRALSEEPIPTEVIERVLHAATLAPSCSNNQSWRYVSVSDGEVLEKIRDCLSSGNYWAKKAPLVILAASKYDLDCQLSDSRNYAFFDLGLATENLILQCFKEGLVAHPIAGFNPLKIKEAIGIPESFTLLTLIIVGYPGAETHLSEKHLESEHGERVRVPQSQVIAHNSWFESGQ